MNKLDYQSVIIVGAPRSGTNMLRDVLCNVAGVDTWPCDEINYIWRHGNVSYKSDEFLEDMVNDSIMLYVKKQFDWVARKYGSHTVVEKTCANSLRVPFVASVVPNAKFIFIRRDGLDVLGSIIKRWKAPLDIPYLMKKARFVPAVDLPYYVIRYLENQLYRTLSKEKRLRFWGPQLNDMSELLMQYKLDEVCAIQWKRCVESSVCAFDSMPASQWIEISYEYFVSHPQEELARIMSFLSIEQDADIVSNAVSGVKRTSVGKGRLALDDGALKRIRPLIADTLARYGYE